MKSTKAFEQWLKEQAQMIVRYRQVEKSDMLAEYNNLKQVVESEEFQAQKTACRQKFLGKLRWSSTPEHQQEKKMQALAKNANIVLYLTHTEEQIAELESYKMVWADEFDGAKMADAWQTGFLYPTADFKADHSHVSEQQAYLKGQNTKVKGSAMHIATKKQKTTAPAWHPTKGMVKHAFAYTSDVWHTTEAIAPKAGVLQAKVRYTGKANHVLCLTTAKAQDALHILSKQAAKGEMIYTLVWNENEVVNYVNDVELTRSKNPLAGEALHLLVRSYLPESQKAGAAQLDIDWVRVYAR